MHQMDSPDNGYDENGKQINKNGGDETDYLYRDGKIIGSKKVFSFTDDSSEISSDYRAYGVKIHTEGTGSTFFEGMKSTAAFMALEGFGSAGLKYLSSKSAQFVLYNSKFLNSNNWIRFGVGSNAANNARVIRLSFGAEPKAYEAMSPGLMKSFNGWLKTINTNGHFYFPGWH